MKRSMQPVIVLLIGVVLVSGGGYLAWQALSSARVAQSLAEARPCSGATATPATCYFVSRAIVVDRWEKYRRRGPNEHHLKLSLTGAANTGGPSQPVAQFSDANETVKAASPGSLVTVHIFDGQPVRVAAPNTALADTEQHPRAEAVQAAALAVASLMFGVLALLTPLATRYYTGRWSEKGLSSGLVPWGPRLAMIAGFGFWVAATAAMVAVITAGINTWPPLLAWWGVGLVLSLLLAVPLASFGARRA